MRFLFSIMFFVLVVFQSCFYSLHGEELDDSSKEPISVSDANTFNRGNLLVDHGSFDVIYRTLNTAETGPVAMPWISHQPDYPPQRLEIPSMPICYNKAPNLSDASVVRLSHVLCRQAGFMIASKSIAVPRDTLSTNTTGLIAFCRGDEQVVAHCQWQRPVWCSHFLAIECGDCSNSHFLAENSHATLVSPGFPVYLPLVACEWNITLLPEHNLLIKFQQFELPSPVYEEAINSITCISGSLEVMSWHEDINKMAVDGRFCGRYSPGNLTIFSNRVLIRFTSGSYRADVFSRKGFMAELSSSLLNQGSSSSGSVFIVRWVLIGCAIVTTVVVVIFLWIWKGRLGPLQKCCFCCCSLGYGGDETTTSAENENSNPLTSIRSSNDVVRLSSTTSRMNGAGSSTGGGSYNGRRQSEIKADQEGGDVRHWEQTQRLEKWHSTQHKNRPLAGNNSNSSSSDNNNNKSSNKIVDRKSTLINSTKDESHLYEEIDCGLSSQPQHMVPSAPTTSTSPPVGPVSAGTPFAIVRNRLINNDPLRVIPYLPLTQPGVQPAVTSPPHPRLPYLPNNPPVLWTSSYFPQSSSGTSESNSSCRSEMYVNPEPYSEEDDE